MGKHGQDLVLESYSPIFFKYQYFYRFGENPFKGFYLGPAIGFAIHPDKGSQWDYGIVFPSVVMGIKISERVFFEVNPNLVFYFSDYPQIFIQSKIGIGF
ncbi:MAG: hypothetical protein AAF443_06295 [Chlamydiota bacterium]